LLSQSLGKIVPAKVISVKSSVIGAKVNIEQRGDKKSFEVEKVLIAVGRNTNTEQLKLENAGIIHDRGKIKVNDKMETNVENIYAIGDCLGGSNVSSCSFFTG